MEGSQVIGQGKLPLQRWMVVEESQEATDEREKRWGTLLILAQGD